MRLFLLSTVVVPRRDARAALQRDARAQGEAVVVRRGAMQQAVAPGVLLAAAPAGDLLGVHRVPVPVGAAGAQQPVPRTSSEIPYHPTLTVSMLPSPRNNMRLP